MIQTFSVRFFIVKTSLTKIYLHTLEVGMPQVQKCSLKCSYHYYTKGHHPKNDCEMFVKCFVNTNLGCVIINLVGIQITFYGLVTIILWLQVPYRKSDQGSML
jgi:hypothetical protein